VPTEKRKNRREKKMHRVTGYINEDMASERKKVPKMMEQSAEMSEQKLRQQRQLSSKSTDIIRYHSGPSEMCTVLRLFNME
jgi:hypothetical protein